jgi:hypothetical protein
VILSADGKDQFPLVLVGGVLEGNKKWNISGEVVNIISTVFPGVHPIRPEVSKLPSISCYKVYFLLSDRHAVFCCQTGMLFSYVDVAPNVSSGLCSRLAGLDVDLIR